ncbi:MAG TPA: hypothetical protein PLS59_07735 [Kiritimatiellia bacterium]|nr:hypothetical protein [Kiritimatiellia bacterium]
MHHTARNLVRILLVPYLFMFVFTVPSIRASASILPMSQPDDSPGRNRDMGIRIQDIEKLVGASAADDLLVRFNYSGAARHVFRDSGLIDLSDLGCSCEEVVSGADCVLQQFARLLGVEVPRTDLAPGIHIPLHGDVSAIKFVQRLAGLEVEGSAIVLRIDPKACRLLSISSTFLTGLRVVENTSEIFPAFSAEVTDLISERLSAPAQLISDEGPAYHVEKWTKSLEAVPVLRYLVQTPDGVHLVRVDAGTQKVVDVEARTWPYASKEVSTNVAARDHANTPGCGGGCSTGYTCVNSSCVKLCTTDAECHSAPFDTDWKCNTATPFYHFCTDPFYSAGTDTVVAYSTAYGWVDPGYQYFHLVSQPKTVLDSLDTWLHDYLGICSWSNDCANPKPLRVRNLIDYDDQTPASGSFDSQNNYMNIFSASDTPLSPTDYSGWSNKYQFYGHEFGHGVYYDVPNSHYPDECASEIQAQIHGALFAAANFSQTWGTYNQSAYLDEVHGLVAGSGWVPYLPYAQRFAFDSAKCIDSMGDTSDFTGVICSQDSDCGPWEYCKFNTQAARNECNTDGNYNNNRPIWQRFARVWAEGSATFSENGLGESMGQVFSGAGLASATAIYSDVIQQGILDTSTTLQDFAYELIANSGVFANATRYALGSIGMLTGDYVVSGTATTDRAVAAMLYSDWALSSNDRNFYSWKEASTGTIRVRYHNGTTYQEVSWTDANAGTAPTMAVRNGRLHVFWADATNGSIKFRYFTSNGSVYGTYSLGGLGGGIKADGDFEAVPFNGYLYLVYRKYGSSGLYVSKCLEPTYGCTSDSSDWVSFGGTYQSSLGILGRPGVGAAAGIGLHGLPPGEAATPYLYVVYSHAGSPNYLQLKVSRVTTGDAVDGSVILHSSAPSSLPIYKIGASLRTAAYSDAGKYLYVAWRDYWFDNSAYISILQSWDGNDGLPNHSNFWFSRPFRLGFETTQGVTLKKHQTNEETAIATEFMYVDGNVPRRGAFYGRY